MSTIAELRHQPRVRAEHDSLEDYLRSVLAEDDLRRPLMVSFTQWDFAVAAVAEVAVTLADMGCQPSLALWSDKTPLRDVGWQVDHGVARVLASATIDQRLMRALKVAGIGPEAFVSVQRPWRPHEPLPVPEGRSRSQIRRLTYRGAPMGRGILEVPPHADVPVTDDFLWPEKYLRKAMLSYAFVFDQTSRVIEERGCTVVFSYNGRFLHDSAVTAAARHHGLPVLFYDSGGLQTDFDLTIEDTHDWSTLQRRMHRMYDSWPLDERDVLGASWFIDRINHQEAANAQFTDSQQQGQGIDRTDNEIVATYFSSSGDEIAELDLDWSDYFDGQEGAILTVAEACRELGIRLVVRTHPHKRHKSKRDVQDWHAAVDRAKPDVHLDEHSDVDSYTLMNQSDVVVTFGSTTGVEAGFAERPVIVMGPSAYDELGCAIRVRNKSELVKALQERRAGTRTNALPYGLMMQRRGFAYRYVDVGADGVRSLAGQPIIEARELVRHVSHAWNRFTRWRLTRP